MFLGVDGGGTKTALCVVTEDGLVAATVQAPSCYYLGKRGGMAMAARVLNDGVAEVCEHAGITPSELGYGFFGLPAYGEVSADLPALDAAARAALGHDRLACGNDMVAGWAGSLGALDGINVVSGTGSICYGERAGERVRVGGWGELFGDEGSGHWIGMRGLQAFSQMSDGRLDEGPLLDLVRARLGLAADLDLVAVTILRWRRDRRRVAALSIVVAEAADRGDEQARKILEDAAAELVSLVDAARRRLGFTEGGPVPVSYSGGVFSAPVVKDEFVRLLAQSHVSWEFREPLYPPVVGAALYAARLAGKPLSTAALARLREQIAATGSDVPTGTGGARRRGSAGVAS
ncbi:MAG TPA: BadF/BadG/BcrA/BcrD ATPase family protein [Cellulomonadaceae bacterium]|nr:BadF/BadG/BcrA/BcrD ATPase family protein [Cellulomonadaceae bacterium]